MRARIVDSLAARQSREREVRAVKRTFRGRPTKSALERRDGLRVTPTHVEVSADGPMMKPAARCGREAGRPSQVKNGRINIPKGKRSARGILVAHVDENAEGDSLICNAERLVETLRLEVREVELTQQQGLRIVFELERRESCARVPSA